MQNGQSTDSKNQHYVPKFYLRNFSVDANQRQIKLFNLKSQRFVSSASIKHEASSNFYYGKDGKVEKNLSQLEGHFATLVSDILSKKERPKYFSEQHTILLYFVISTELRNPIRKKIYEQMTDGMFKSLMSIDPKIKDKPGFQEALDSIEIIPNDSSTFSLQYTKDASEIVLDLHIKLLLNEASVPFLTSDNPVIKYNQLLESKSTSNSITGFGLQGLQIFIPLNENLMLLLYDEQPYYVGSKKQRNVILNKKEDIDQLNVMQDGQLHFKCLWRDTSKRNLCKGDLRKGQITSRISSSPSK